MGERVTTATLAPLARVGAIRFSGWLPFALNRLLDAVLVLWAAATLAFVALKLIPGDPLDSLLAGVLDAPPELRAQVAAHYGLDQPVFVQYLNYLGQLARGDLGTSYQRAAPVTEIIFSELGATIELTLTAMTIAVVVAVGLALLTSGRNRSARWAAQAVELVAISVPSFWLGILLMNLLSFTFPVFPAFGANGPASLMLPAVTLSVPLIGVLSQVLRERMEYTLHEPFVTTVLARGVSEGALRSRHVLRHAAIPALTLSTLILGSLLSGAAVLETLFARPGLGRIAVSAVADRDIPVVLGTVVFAALVFVVVNTLVDLVYPLFDPRLREARR